MDDFPDDVRQFLDQHVESIEQLEILRALAEDPVRFWIAADLAREVQASAGATAAHLTALHARGLLVASPQDGELVARHGPHTPALEAGLTRALQLYRERPVTMIRLVYARANKRLQAFTDAFKLKKDD